MSFLSRIVLKSPRIEKQFAELFGVGAKEKLPVVFYGAAGYAVKLKDYLSKKLIEVDDFFVSDDYINDPEIKFSGVKTFKDVLKFFNKFNVVIARGEIDQARKIILEKNSSQVSGVFDFMPNDLSLDFLISNEVEFQKVLDLLSDDLSKETLISIINARITCDCEYIKKIICKSQYFIDKIVFGLKGEVFVDGGAFTGDTLAFFIRDEPYLYSKYYAFEPDIKNYTELVGFVREKNLKDIFIFSKGLWSMPGTLNFLTGCGSASSLCVNSASVLEERDDSARGEMISIQVDTIDNLCPDATFIKMDIEGAELEALKGAAETIRRNRPKLAICVYHKPEHLFEIPLYIHSLVPEYRLYLRHHSELETETVLYAVP